MKYFNLVILTVSLTLLSACNTMEGLGKDIKQGGSSLENAASKSKADDTKAIKGSTTNGGAIQGKVQAN